jgi:hypothetical protein
MLACMEMGQSAEKCGCADHDEDGAKGAVGSTFHNVGAVDAVSVVTWNIAAVNNNPFEYWLTISDPAYMNLMVGVENLLERPASRDIKVGEVFTDQMFNDLKEHLKAEGVAGINEVEKSMWTSGELRLRERRIISEFIKDKSLGAKRLISMPDRVTNTINIVTQRDSVFQPPPSCRPTVINNYDQDVGTMEGWWKAWLDFMFRNALVVRTRDGSQSQRPFEMLEPIPRTKYPAVTEDEERLARPLQILCLAIFDAVMVHMMNLLSPDGTWMNVKSNIMNSLYKNKGARTLEILAKTYGTCDIHCLQEVAATFRDRFRGSLLSETHEAVFPAKLDGKRDQNSLILLRKGTFEVGSIAEVTESIAKRFPKELKLADGDLLVVTYRSSAGPGGPCSRLVVSFHGDTNGLLSWPMLNAVDEAARQEFPNHHLILGVDANLYAEESKEKMSFVDFMQKASSLGYSSCFGDNPDPKGCITTCNARTFLQPQLNKAIRQKDRVALGDRNPKDTILFRSSQSEVWSRPNEQQQPNPLKDNTGSLEYLEDTVFPTLDFPSDHGVVATTLKVKA